MTIDKFSGSQVGGSSFRPIDRTFTPSRTPPTAKNLSAMRALDAEIAPRAQGGTIARSFLGIVGRSKASQAESVIRQATGFKFPAIKGYIDDKVNDALNLNKASIHAEIEKAVAKSLKEQQASHKSKFGKEMSEKEIADYTSGQREKHIEKYQAQFRENAIKAIKEEYSTYRKLQEDLPEMRRMANSPSTDPKIRQQEFSALKDKLMHHLEKTDFTFLSGITNIPVENLIMLYKLLDNTEASEVTEETFKQISDLLTSPSEQLQAAYEGAKNVLQVTQSGISSCLATIDSINRGEQYHTPQGLLALGKQMSPDETARHHFREAYISFVNLTKDALKSNALSQEGVSEKEITTLKQTFNQVSQALSSGGNITSLTQQLRSIQEGLQQLSLKLK